MASKSQQPVVPWYLALLGLVLGGIFGNATASSPPKTTTTTTWVAPSTTTTTTSTTIPSPTTFIEDPANISGQPRFNANASWNRTAAELGRADESLQQYVTRLYQHGGGAAPPGRAGVAFGDYSIPEYSAKDATTKVKFYQTTWSQNLYVSQIRPGTEIPWNPKWTPGTGNDNLMMIVDEQTGEVWELGGIGQPKINCAELYIELPFPFTQPKPPNLKAGFNIDNPNHVCMSNGLYYDNLYSASDVDGSTRAHRGMGINKAALIARAAEVESGAIKHALGMTITNTMFGRPACNPMKGPDIPGFGTECGGYVAPATKLERINPNTGCPAQEVSVAARSKTTPEGMRFALNISDAEIETWLDSRGYSGPIRETARIFAVALRDYGFIISESGCYGMHLETDSVIGGNAAPVWQKLGIELDGTPIPKRDLLHGLLTETNIYVVNPPS